MANAHGDRVFFAAKVADATGITTTIAAAGTFVALKDETLLVEAGKSDLCPYSMDAETGVITVDARHGAGKVRLTATLSRAKGTNSKQPIGAWHRLRGSTTTALTPNISFLEPAAALERSHGPAVVFDDAEVGDKYSFRLDSTTNGDTVIVKQASLVIEKVESAF
jgi:hypothetical protein